MATKHHQVLSFATLGNCIGTQAINQDHRSFHLYFIHCITCTLCKKLYIGETGRRLGDRFREHLRDVPDHSKQRMAVCDVSLHQRSTESRKTLEQKFIFQIGTLNPNGINEHFSFNSIKTIILDELFEISIIIEVEVGVISRSRRLRLITLTKTSIILDITKTESNNCFIIH